MTVWCLPTTIRLKSFFSFAYITSLNATSPSELKTSEKLKNNIMDFSIKNQSAVDPSDSPINGFLRFSKKNPNLTSSGLIGNVLENRECFHDKLSHLHESSGLNLLIDVRKTLLDLHVLYKEVVKRGGFNQVNKENRWEEVAFALKLERVDHKYGCRLQNAYALFLYQFEQMFFYRSPEKTAKSPDFAGHTSYLENSSAKKQEILEAPEQILAATRKVPVEKKDKCDPKLTASTPAELKVLTEPKVQGEPKVPTEPKVQGEPKVPTEPKVPAEPTEPKVPAEPKVLSPETPSESKEMKKRPGAYLGRRTGYNIFIKQECDRLKKIHGKSLDGKNFREMAISAWRCLSESDRQQYLEESKKYKRTTVEENTASIGHQDIQDTDTENNTAD